MAERILVADDERTIVDSIAYTLEREGFAVDVARDGTEATGKLATGGYDLAVLDVLMPGKNGLDLCREIRAEGDLPVILLTAKDSEVDRVVGLEIGADDYVTKPFSMPELVGRVRALLRRRRLDREAAAAGGAVVERHGVRLDLAGHTVTVDGQPIRVTASEFKLLVLLATHPGQVFSRRQLMEHLWDGQFFGDERAADTHVANLRRKIERSAAVPERVLTVRGAGFKFA